MKKILKEVWDWAIKTALGKFLVVTLLGGIIKIAVGLGLAQLIALLAIGTISYQGSLFTLDWLQTQITFILSGLSPETYQLISMVATRLQLDVCFSIIFTAFATVLSLWTFKGVWRVFGFGGA